ncbi:sensitivity to red-light reduced protein [Dispira parvispora]|uniref:Sensitivity to red-light reduced protein n=1 Tax=Dispira parvispora TaxID=1520584 RepID=A0A9W8E4V0_9FUNG|nr:sensitivity to red-light reduced protein [Dispira parvispora]
MAPTTELNGLGKPRLAVSTTPPSLASSAIHCYSPTTPRVIPSINLPTNMATAVSPNLSLASPLSSSSSSSTSSVTLGPVGKPLRILVVDDNALHHLIISRMLHKYFPQCLGSVRHVTSGQEALMVLAHQVFDIILLDIDMPEMNGVETAQRIRTGQRDHVLLVNQTVPIVAITTSDGLLQRQLYFKAGITDCFSKPLRIGDLVRALEHATPAVSLNPTSPIV